MLLLKRADGEMREAASVKNQAQAGDALRGDRRSLMNIDFRQPMLIFGTPYAESATPASTRRNIIA